MNLPKMADCSDCLTYQPVKWQMTLYGAEALCARCLRKRRDLAALTRRQAIKLAPPRPKR